MNRAERRRQKKVASKARAESAPLAPKQQSAPIAALLESGLQVHKAGRISEATALYEQVLQADPGQPDALRLLGTIADQKGDPDRAIALISLSLAKTPGSARGHLTLGNVYQGQGKFAAALSCFQQAISIAPDFHEAHNNAGLALRALGKYEDAFAFFRHATTLNPGEVSYWEGAVSVIGDISFETVDESLWKWLVALLEQPTVQPRLMRKPIFSALIHHHLFVHWLEATTSAKSSADVSYSEASQDLSSIPLFLRILELIPISFLKMERMLSLLRHALLKEALAGKLTENGLPFSVALASNCFVSEYVFAESSEETEDVGLLRREIEARLEAQKEIPPCLLAALGAYRPLHRFAWAHDLATKRWPEPAQRLILQQVREPLEEQAIRTAIPHLTPIEGAVSQSVRAQYEENPYPRWVTTFIKKAGNPIGTVLRTAPLSLSIKNYTSPERPDILVAGCGTGQHALSGTSRYANANVLALDLSLGSLAYAVRKTKERGISNIEYAQADIMELGGMERRFDLIACSGVLHHLGDPMAGWRILVNLLRPGGLMEIGLYSETARRHVVAGRSLIAKKGYTATPEDIRQCRQEIIALAENGDPDMQALCESGDFYNLSECRDLLFHVQEHRFTLPEIGAALETLKLKFLGFEMLDQRPLIRFKEMHPDKQALTSLPLWHEFELKNPDTFRSMYQFWCQKE